MKVFAACFLLASWSSQGQPVAPGPTGLAAEEPQGSIEGRLVLAGTGEPLAGIDIFLMSSAVQTLPQKTDSTGHFKFAHLEAHSYGFALFPTSGYLLPDKLIAVRKDQRVAGVELKAYAVPTISGRVRDAHSRARSGLMVWAIKAPVAGGRYPPSAAGLPATTSESGEFKLSVISPGRYTLLVTAPPLVITTREWKDDEKAADSETEPSDVRTYYPNADSLDLAAAFSVEAGRALEGMEITLAQERTYCVRSKFLDPEGRKTERVRAQIVADLYFGSAAIAKGDLAVGEKFEVCGLPAGGYRLVANLADPQSGGRYASELFTLADGSLRISSLTLQPLIPLPGHLEIDFKGDPAPLPAPVSISLQAIGRPGNPDERPFVQVTQPGAFVIPAVQPDEYWLTVKAPKGFYVKSATMQGWDVLRTKLHAAGGELNIVLGQDGPTLSVQAVDTDGNPVSTAEMILAREPLSPSYAPDDLVLRLSDQSGLATMSGIAPGEYRLLVVVNADVGPVNLEEFYRANRSKGEAVTLAPGESRSIQLKALDLAPRH